jgi:hypothetical protein
MIGYIITNNGKYQNINCQIGKEYKLVKIDDSNRNILKESGFYFFCNLENIDYFQFKEKYIKIFKIEILGNSICDYVGTGKTDHIKIIREIPKYELEHAANGMIKFDKNGNIIYFEYMTPVPDYVHENKGEIIWIKGEFDKNNNQIYEEWSNGYWEKMEYDENNNCIYEENCDGRVKKSEYDENNNRTYHEIIYPHFEGKKEKIIIS